MLARVAAAALRGDTTPETVDRLPFLLRTVVDLDAAHVSLLVLIGEAPGQGSDQLAERWSGPRDLLLAAAVTLERAGLADRMTPLIGAPYKAWSLTMYGQQFLDYLLVDAGGWPPKR